MSLKLNSITKSLLGYFHWAKPSNFFCDNSPSSHAKYIKMKMYKLIMYTVEVPYMHILTQAAILRKYSSLYILLVSEISDALYTYLYKNSSASVKKI